MTFSDNRTPELWRSFLRDRSRVGSPVNDLFSVTIYPDGFFDSFCPSAAFEKWAAVAVNDDTNPPDDMGALVIPAGEYAVFHYKGSSAEAAEIFGYIFKVWLPGSGYRVDNRPHFEILGEKYKNAQLDSEEDIYIPVKRVIE
jgi:AraC family transcriptional regulator